MGTMVMLRVYITKQYLKILYRCASEDVRSLKPKYKPSNLEKTLLIWTKKYKNKEDIPSHVSPDIIERTRSEARIKIANILMLLTAVSCFFVVLSSKAAAKRGESIHQKNLDWHKQYNEEYEAKNPANLKRN